MSNLQAAQKSEAYLIFYVKELDPKSKKPKVSSTSNIDQLIEIAEKSKDLKKEARMSFLTKRTPYKETEGNEEETPEVKEPVQEDEDEESGDNEGEEEDNEEEEEQEKVDADDSKPIMYRDMDLMKDNHYWNEEAREDLVQMKDAHKNELDRVFKTKDEYDYEYDLGKQKKVKKKSQKREITLDFDRIQELKEKKPHLLKMLQKKNRKRIDEDKQTKRDKKRTHEFRKKKKDGYTKKKGPASFGAPKKKFKKNK